MKRKKIVLFVFLLVAILITIIIYNDKKNTLNNDKLIIKKSYAIMIKGDGETSYTNANSIPSDLTNYHIDTDKTFCENGGTVDIVGNKLSYQSLGADRCTVYMYYEVIPDIKMNIETPSYLLSGYTKSVTNCKGTNSTIWNSKLNGIEVSNWNDFVKCDIEFTQKTPSSSELLTTIVNNNGTSTTHGIRYQGTDPNNYVWYNDELWRIIGNIPVCLTSGCSSTENRVKLIRNDIIGSFLYDKNMFNTTNQFTWLNTNIQNLLNKCYLGKTSSCDDYCYAGTDTIGMCNYSLIGIDEDSNYGKMVENVYYYIGFGDKAFHTADDQYDLEINRYSSSLSKIGLMYASDFGYAVEGYSGIIGYGGTIEQYTQKNWLFMCENEWLIGAYSDTIQLWISNGYLSSNVANVNYATRPVLYLKPDVYVVSGTGTQVDPYRIGM